MGEIDERVSEALGRYIDLASEKDLETFTKKIQYKLTLSPFVCRTGAFSRIKNIAKYDARLGQSFDSLKQSLGVARYEKERLPSLRLRLMISVVNFDRYVIVVINDEEGKEDCKKSRMLALN
nr:probable RNA-dependent RNA polymerase 1 [Tanacetum cinerariifolium]